MILNQATDIMYGAKEVQKVYAGQTLVWERGTHDYTLSGTPPLRFHAPSSYLTDYRIDGNTGGVGNYDSTSGKYLIPVTIRGKNLFNYGYSMTYARYLDENGDLISNANYVTSPMIRISGTVALSFQPTYMNARVVSMCAYDFSGTFIESVLFQAFTPVSSDAVSFTVNLPTNTEYVRFSFLWGSLPADTYIQLEYGDTATDFENYLNASVTPIQLDAPLRNGQNISMSDIGAQIGLYEGTNTLTVDTRIKPELVHISYEEG